MLLSAGGILVPPSISATARTSATVGPAGATVLTSPGITTVAGHPLFAWTTMGTSALSVATPWTDSKGNAFVEVGTQIKATDVAIRCFACNNPTSVGAAHTFGFNYQATEFAHMQFFQVLNAPGGVDINAQGIDPSDPRTLSTAGPTNNGNQLVLALIATAEIGTVPYNDPAGYTGLMKETSGTQFWSGASAFKVISAAGIQSVSWNSGSSGTARGVLKLITFMGN